MTLYANDPNLPTDNQPSVSTFGHKFHIRGDAIGLYEAYRVGWYRYGAGTGTPPTGRPIAVGLYDSFNRTFVGTASDLSADDNTVGWHWFTLDNPVPLLAERVYIVVFASPTTAQQVAHRSGDIAVQPPAPLWSDGACSVGGGGPTYPNSNFANRWYVDVDVRERTYGVPGDGGGGGTGGATPEEVDAKLTAWFTSTNDNTHQTDLPWLTKDRVDAIKTIVDQAVAAIETIPKKDDSDWTQIKKLWQIAGNLTEIEIAAWNLFAQRAPSQLTGASGGGGSAFFGPGGTQVSAGVEALLNRSDVELVGFPAAPWTLGPETDFVGELAWAEEAHLYVVNFTDLGSNRVNTTVAGADLSYRLAWWTILNGTFAQERHYIDFPLAHLWAGGTRMPGLLLRSQAGASGHVQAWLRA